MTTLRQTMFPYALERNSDGTWTLLNRKYKPLGVVSEEFAEYDDPDLPPPSGPIRVLVD